MYNVGGTVERSLESKEKKANYPRQCRFEGDGKSNGRRNVVVSDHLLTAKARFYQCLRDFSRAFPPHVRQKQTPLHLTFKAFA